MSYVDGFVLPIARNRIEEYRRIAEQAAAIWKDHGALDYWECVGDDLAAEGMRSFRELAAAADDETVIFAWAVFASKEARDAANAKICVDPRMAPLMEPVQSICDLSRMAAGGFRALVHPGDGADREAG